MVLAEPFCRSKLCLMNTLGTWCTSYHQAVANLWIGPVGVAICKGIPLWSPIFLERPDKKGRPRRDAPTNCDTTSGLLDYADQSRLKHFSADRFAAIYASVIC